MRMIVRLEGFMTDSTIASVRAALVESAVQFLGDKTEEEVASFRRRVTDLVDTTGNEELSRVVDRVQSTGSGWGYHPPEPFARAIHWAMADVALTSDSALSGGAALETLSSGRTAVFLSNHLSYADANLFEILLHRFGFDDISSKLTVIAGPKVYAELFRRFSSLCFGTIKTPQSSSRSSGEAVMPPREVARIAQQTISCAEERQKLGDHLLIFLEGTRSRSGGMQRGLPAVARYFEYPGSVLVPVGITGTEDLFPVGANRVQASTVRVRIGTPIEPERLSAAARGNRRVMVDAMGLRIASLLPPQYRGAYGEGAAADLEGAKRAAEQLSEP